MSEKGVNKGLRIIRMDTTKIGAEVSEDVDQMVQWIEENTFNVRPFAEYDGMNPDDWKILRMVQLYPDAALFRMEEWFGFPVKKFLVDLTDQEKDQVIESILTSLRSMSPEEKTSLLTRMQRQEVPVFVELQSRHWSEDWKGFTEEMVRDDGRIQT
jgi:hypothetical protein